MLSGESCQVSARIFRGTQWEVIAESLQVAVGKILIDRVPCGKILEGAKSHAGRLAGSRGHRDSAGLLREETRLIGIGKRGAPSARLEFYENRFARQELLQLVVRKATQVIAQHLRSIDTGKYCRLTGGTLRKARRL